ncbi:MAG: hypothetical protein M3468_15160 [Acidobacteriota bacterium]|nr:hypothetical protein [Acidobacteriota bacterium]
MEAVEDLIADLAQALS